MRRLLVVLGAIALLLPANAFARGDFDPTKEFEQKEWVPIHLGPLDLSITKAVAYLMIASVVTILFGIFFMRTKIGSKPGRKETVGEMVYEIAQTQVAEQGLPSKAIGRWFPYVATLMLFIFVVNFLGFIPLPLTGETYHGVPTWGIYAATSSISVTLALAILTFIGLIFILQSIVLAVVVVPVGILFYLFEVIIVIGIQAFIFAALSAIYIGSAIEPEH